jgi:hypothetical protein
MLARQVGICKGTPSGRGRYFAPISHFRAEPCALPLGELAGGDTGAFARLIQCDVAAQMGHQFRHANRPARWQGGIIAVLHRRHLVQRALFQHLIESVAYPVFQPLFGHIEHQRMCVAQRQQRRRRVRLPIGQTAPGLKLYLKSALHPRAVVHINRRNGARIKGGQHSVARHLVGPRPDRRGNRRYIG